MKKFEVMITCEDDVRTYCANEGTGGKIVKCLFRFGNGCLECLCRLDGSGMLLLLLLLLLHYCCWNREWRNEEVSVHPSSIPSIRIRPMAGGSRVVLPGRQGRRRTVTPSHCRTVALALADRTRGKQSKRESPL